MDNLSPYHIFVMFLSISVLLGSAHLLGELAQRFRQPAVLGELLAGILLGPSVLGKLSPTTKMLLFPSDGPNATLLGALATLAVGLFLVVAGMEVNLSIIWKQGKVGFKLGITSVMAPFIVGFISAWLAPQAFGSHIETERLVFSLLFATALSISALSIIARILMEMNLYRTDLGMVIVSAAVFNDLMGWIMFAIILGLVGSSSHGIGRIVWTVVLTLAFVGFMLSIGKWVINKILPFLQAYTEWPKGVLGFAVSLAFLGAALTEKFGVHAIFGAFVVGIAVGDSPHLRESTRVIIKQFISSIFAPIFFASIGLRLDIVRHFDALLVVAVLIIACISKLIGSGLGALWGGMSKRESLAVAFGMNTRGAMEIILGMVALNEGLIKENLFVALVTMAIVTSMMTRPAMRFVLKLPQESGLLKALSSKLFVRELRTVSRHEAIRELAAKVCEVAQLEGECVVDAVWEREEMAGTGLGNGVAVPHARLEGLEKPTVVVGISDRGVDFDAPDGKPANVIFLLLTPLKDASAQLELTAEIAKLFRYDSFLTEKIIKTNNFTEFYSLIKTASHELEMAE